MLQKCQVMCCDENGIIEKQTLTTNKFLIGVSCQGHSMNTCIHHAAVTLDANNDLIIINVYQTFQHPLQIFLEIPLYNANCKQIFSLCKFNQPWNETAWLFSLSEFHISQFHYNLKEQQVLKTM